MKPESSSIRQTPAGFVALWTAVGFLAIGLFLLSAPVLLIGFLLLSTWFLCRYLATRNLLGLQVRRPLPARAWVNRSFAVEAVFSRAPSARSRRRMRELRVSDPIAVAKLHEIPRLSHSTETELNYAARCSRRGHVRTRQWTAISDWPLGWFENRTVGDFVEDKSASNSILVLPDPFLPPGLQDQIEGLLTAHALWTGVPDPTSEFRLLREFRNGDPVRQIHWPASLRNGDLLVREPDPPRPMPSRYGILIHSFSPPGEMVTPESFEMILRIAAGLLYRFREAGIEIVYHPFPREAVRLRHREDFDRELDQLALAIRSPFSSLRNLDPAFDEFQHCDEVFVLSDASRIYWESNLVSQLGRCHCIDSKSLSLGSKPIVSRAKGNRKRRIAS
jgi:uncharacterized protein (DUF58 family)